MQTFDPRPGHAAEHEVGTRRAGRADDPVGGRPVSRSAGFTWQVRGGEIFTPWSALIAGRRGYAPNVMDHVHRGLLAFETASARRAAPELPTGAMLIVSELPEQVSTEDRVSPGARILSEATTETTAETVSADREPEAP